MAYALDLNDYQTTIFSDDMSGTPDNWTDDAATHSFASGVMSVIDDSAVASESVYYALDTDAVTEVIYVRFLWQVDAHAAGGSGNNFFFHWTDASANDNVGLFINATTGLITAIDGAGSTSTGITLANDVAQYVELLINSDTDKYEVYLDGGLIAEYSIRTATDRLRLTLGGGASAPTFTFKYDEMIIKQGLATGETPTSGYRSLLGVGI